MGQTQGGGNLSLGESGFLAIAALEKLKSSAIATAARINRRSISFMARLLLHCGPHGLTPEEFAALLPELNLRERAMVILAGSTGLRRSELVALTWNDIDLV